MKGLILLVIFSLLYGSDPIPGPRQTHPILLKNGIIHTVSRETLYGGDLLFDQGKIVRVEMDIVPTPDTEVLDVTGKHVYPGLIAGVT
ncbi:MAG: hypothetical protein ACE5D1_09570, partial [Fidelibacterota bacterium]